MLESSITGSLPKPAWLAEPERLWAAWVPPTRAALAEAKRDAVRLAILDQERAGLDIVSDGEQSRRHFVHGFLEGIEGIDFTRMQRIGIRADRYQADCPSVVAKVARPAPVHAAEVAFARAQTDKPLKFTLPGPMTIVDTLADAHYRDRPAMAMDFAALLNDEAKDLVAAGADVIQFDEPAFNVYLDEVGRWGLAALDRAVEGLDCTTAVHICYGYGIEANIRWKRTLGDVWAQYRATLPAIADSAIDQVALEFAGGKVPIEVIALLEAGKDVLVGAIDVARDEVETPEQVAAIIRKALDYAPPTRIFPCTNCGMAPMKREIAAAKMAALARGAAIVRAEIEGRR